MSVSSLSLIGYRVIYKLVSSFIFTSFEGFAEISYNFVIHFCLPFLHFWIIILYVRNDKVSDIFYAAKIQFRKMGDNKKVEPVNDEVLSDNESVDSDDYIPEGCQKLYCTRLYLNDGPAKKYITMDDGSELLTFRANRKPAEKYYETIKSKIKIIILICITCAV